MSEVLNNYLLVNVDWYFSLLVVVSNLSYFGVIFVNITETSTAQLYFQSGKINQNSVDLSFIFKHLLSGIEKLKNVRRLSPRKIRLVHTCFYLKVINN